MNGDRDFLQLQEFFLKTFLDYEFSVSSTFWEKFSYQMDQERCQEKRGGVLKALAPIWHQFSSTFLIKIALFGEKSRRDFSQNGYFSFFLQSFLPRFWTISGIKWIKSGAKRSLEVF